MKRDQMVHVRIAIDVRLRPVPEDICEHNVQYSEFKLSLRA
jgi:hypothetical protein